MTIETQQHVSSHFFLFFLYDLLTFINNSFLLVQTLFYTDYQDFIVMVTYHSPELIFALNDYFLLFFNNTAINQTPSIVFDTYMDSLNITLSEFLEYFLLFCSFI